MSPVIRLPYHPRHHIFFNSFIFSFAHETQQETSFPRQHLDRIYVRDVGGSSAAAVPSHYVYYRGGRPLQQQQQQHHHHHPSSGYYVLHHNQRALPPSAALPGAMPPPSRSSTVVQRLNTEGTDKKFNARMEVCTILPK